MNLNQSQAVMFTRCGEQWRRRYVEEEILPPGVALVRGTSVHHGAKYNWTQKVDTGMDLPVNEVVDYAVNSFQEQVKNEGILLNEEEEATGKDVVLNEAETTVVKLTELYAQEVGPAYQPSLVEEKLEIDFPDLGGEPLTVHGTIDCASNRDEIVDLKTLSRAPNQEDYESAIQSRLYPLLYRKATGKVASKVVIEGLVNTKTVKRAVLELPVRREDLVPLTKQMQAVAFAMKAGVVIPAYGQQGAWWCSKKFCGYWSTCPFVPAHKR